MIADLATTTPAPAPGVVNLRARQNGSLEVSSEPATAFESVDLSSTDATFAAGSEPRALWCDAAGTIKVDGFQRDGKTASTGITFTTAGAGPVPVGRVSKVYKTGTNVNVIALW